LDHMKVLAFLFLTFLTFYVFADSWMPPVSIAAVDNTGHFVAKTTVGKSMGDVYGFAGADAGEYAKVKLYAYNPVMDSYKKLSEFDLRNPISPVEVVLTDNGYIITLDNWHNMGIGEIVSVYSPDGKYKRGFSLSDFYSLDELNQIRESVSSKWWRCDLVFYDSFKGVIVIGDYTGGTVELNPYTGDFKKRAGTGKCE